jgi:hypothetical protein
MVETSKFLCFALCLISSAAILVKVIQAIIDDGILWHDDILKISNYMFNTYPLLCDILKDKYKYILIDEYQDTEKQVVDIFLKYIPKSSDKKNVVGFFGDIMQSIYGYSNVISFSPEYLIPDFPSTISCLIKATRDFFRSF